MSVLRWENRLATMVNEDVSLAIAVARWPILSEEVDLTFVQSIPPSVSITRCYVTRVPVGTVNSTSQEEQQQQQRPTKAITAISKTSDASQRGTTTTSKTTASGLPDNRNSSRVKSQQANTKMDNDKNVTGTNKPGKSVAALSTVTNAVAQKRKASSSLLSTQTSGQEEQKKRSKTEAAVPTEGASAGVQIADDSDVEILEELEDEELEENGMGHLSPPPAPPPSPVMKRRKMDMEHNGSVVRGGRKRGGMYLDNRHYQVWFTQLFFYYYYYFKEKPVNMTDNLSFNLFCK